jgi:hypothetical protein
MCCGDEWRANFQFCFPVHPSLTRPITTSRRTQLAASQQVLNCRPPDYPSKENSYRVTNSNAPDWFQRSDSVIVALSQEHHLAFI